MTYHHTISSHLILAPSIPFTLLANNLIAMAQPTYNFDFGNTGTIQSRLLVLLLVHYLYLHSFRNWLLVLSFVVALLLEGETASKGLLQPPSVWGMYDTGSTHRQ
ncbi:hypothetical protein GALMADRAFT_705240 [Galerina marginata CBS 339.88]|uniref:Uncharacterized protein n=1 Tax=Galerina marginata (strain CBS 339.88) TaxID=685588 RepID=A0A067TWD0_GALM3|nr:hypothetical protein GALMADRAFT_705240 [Galerina marginata CBS 339.88]